MPVKRALQLEDKENTPFKRHAPARNYSPVTGTMPMSSMAKTQVTGNCVTRGRTVNSLETEEPLSETERDPPPIHPYYCPQVHWESPTFRLASVAATSLSSTAPKLQNSLFQILHNAHPIQLLRLVFFRTKMEEYVETLMKTRQQLETLLPIEGNSELRSFLLMGPADLLAELKRHKELIAKLDRCVHAVPNPTSYLEGATQIGSSYEFLKKIFSD